MLSLFSVSGNSPPIRAVSRGTVTSALAIARASPLALDTVTRSEEPPPGRDYSTLTIETEAI